MECASLTWFNNELAGIIRWLSFFETEVDLFLMLIRNDNEEDEFQFYPTFQCGYTSSILIPTAQSDWGDGAFVDDSGKQCTVQTANSKQKLKAKVESWDWVWLKPCPVDWFNFCVFLLWLNYTIYTWLWNTRIQTIQTWNRYCVPTASWRLFKASSISWFQCSFIERGWYGRIHGFQQRHSLKPLHWLLVVFSYCCLYVHQINIPWGPYRILFNKLATMWGPQDISWFISPSNYML